LGQSDEPLFSNVSVVARDLGFDSWRFVVLDQHPMDAPLLMTTTLPAPFVDHYVEQQLYTQDPRHRHALSSLQPLRWEPELFNDAPQLWEAMRDVDITQGLSQACHHSSGLIAQICFGRSTPALSVAEFEEKISVALPLAHQLTVATVERIANDQTLEPYVGEPDKVLTPREITVLAKTAAGYTAAQIALQMHLSERTVQFHIASTIIKLEVPNKTAAAIRALALGLIHLD
jgi:LuxR family transcriptional regulator